MGKTLARCGRVDLLEIDELGYLELDGRGAEMLFHVLTGRGRKISIAVASNEASRVEPHLHRPGAVRAMVDRPAFSATLIDWNRVLQARPQRWSQAPAEKDVGLRSSHCPNVRRGGRTTTRPWAF
ncbi:ATP-binding protein [Streptomyces mirabilis]